MTICALLLGAAVLRPAARHAAEVRDARPAVRQRLDRRHADALRRAAGADGGAAVGMGHAVHADALRLARGRCDRRVDRGLLRCCSDGSCARWPTAPPCPTSSSPTTRPARRALLPVPPWVTAVHLAFMAWTVFNAHYPALFLGGFLFFLGFARATAPYQSRIELQDSAAGRASSSRAS